ncbi:glycosyltransferase [Streptomyces sp. CFMR 7]|uniref:glycosyltransferase n=1 Tax=Streptomyces sp. CFMR 7 TaxID=1649184 RepID=UPI00119D77D6|nr:glycosyltransferase [Streptomyces sp. CFMR 7]
MRALFCSLSDPGYLYPTTAVALETHRRGHTVFIVSSGPAARAAEEAGLTVLPTDGAFAVSRWFRSAYGQYEHVRQAVRRTRPDVLVTSVLCPGVLVAAEMLGLPVVVLGLVCHLWPHRGAERGADPQDRAWRLNSTLDVHRALRAELGLHDAGAAGQDALLGTSFLLRGHPSLEPPGTELPERVHHVGPCWWEPPADEGKLHSVQNRLDRVGKPVVYVHLGRVFGGESLWPWIQRAFTAGEFQAIVELGRSAEPPALPAAADVTIVRLPWMSPLLERSDLVVSSGTSAPVLGSLLHRRPLLVSPNGGEQAVLAAACRRAGVAAVLDRTRGGGQLRTAADDDVMTGRTHRMSNEFAQAKSESRAAQAVEETCP